MDTTQSSSPFYSLACALVGLRGMVGGWARRGILDQALMWLVYRRISAAMGQMERLAVRFLAGTLRPSAPRVAAASVRHRVGGTRIWPGTFGWLCRLVSWEAGQWGAPLRHALEQPEMQALLAASPQAGRIMLPVCRMLAIEASLLRPGKPVVARPPRPVVVRVATKRPPVDWGRIPLPRGALTWAKRHGFGKIPRGQVRPALIRDD